MHAERCYGTAPEVRPRTSNHGLLLGTPASVDRRRSRYTRATFENSPPIGAMLTPVTHADVGTRALRRSPCRRTQRRRGRPHRSRQPTSTRLQDHEVCPSSRVQRPEWGVAHGAPTPMSGVMVEPRPIERSHPEHFVVTRMGHNEMLAEAEHLGCQQLTSALIAKGPTCVARRRNGKSPTGQHRNQESWGGAEGVRPNLLLHFGVGLHARSMPAA